MNAPKKILLIQLKRAGDVLVTTPIVEELHNRFPDSTIDFLVDKVFVPLLMGNPFVHRILPFEADKPYRTWWDVRRERYTHIFDFQSSPRSALVCLTSGAGYTAGFAKRFWGNVYDHSVAAPAPDVRVERARWSVLESVAGPLGDIPTRKLMLTPDETAWGESIIPPQAEPVIGIIPTSRLTSRLWHLDSFAQVANLFLEEKAAVWVFWGPGEESYVEALREKAPGVRLIPKTTFRQMGALFKRCDVVVTNDNGPMHTAVSVGTPTVTIYGSTNPGGWNPGGPTHLVIRDVTLPCIACDLVVCPIGHDCMVNIKPALVHETAKNLLQSVHVNRTTDAK